MEDFQAKAKKVGIAALILFLSSGFIITSLKLFLVWRAWRAIQQDQQRMQAKIDYYAKENKRLRDEITIADTPEAIERDGKARLNMKRPDEEVVVVVASTTTAPESPPRTWWQRARNFFLSWF